MDYLAVIAKISGVMLLLGTFRSIYRHFFMHRVPYAKNSASNHNGPASHNNVFGKNGIKAPAAASASVSISEKLLNNLLLYLWFAFLLSFSIGLILNN